MRKYTVYKKLRVFTLFYILTLPTIIFGQEEGINKVFEATELHFYGYDFTGFKLVGRERVGEGFRVKPLFFQIIHFLNGRSPESDFERWYVKEKVTFHQDVTKKLNSEIDISMIIDNNQTGQSHHIPKENLQGMINNYDIKEVTGIGHVIIIGCFNEDVGETNAWFVYFDTSTKKIISAHESVSPGSKSEQEIDENNLEEFDFGGFGWARKWGSTVSAVHSVYMIDYYNPKFKTFKKTH